MVETGDVAPINSTVKAGEKFHVELAT